MKATGEVMAIDRTFEAAFQKAVRSLEVGTRSVLWEDRDAEADPIAAAAIPTDNRLWHVLQAIRAGASPDRAGPTLCDRPVVPGPLPGIDRYGAAAALGAARARPDARRQAHGLRR